MFLQWNFQMLLQHLEIRSKHLWERPTFEKVSLELHHLLATMDFREMLVNRIERGEVIHVVEGVFLPTDGEKINLAKEEVKLEVIIQIMETSTKRHMTSSGPENLATLQFVGVLPNK